VWRQRGDGNSDIATAMAKAMDVAAAAAVAQWNHFFNYIVM
jgi:hypothetical protein